MVTRQDLGVQGSWHGVAVCIGLGVWGLGFRVIRVAVSTESPIFGPGVGGLVSVKGVGLLNLKKM